MNTIHTAAESFGLTEAATMGGSSPLQRRNYTPQRKRHILEAQQLWGRAWSGDIRASVLVREALSTSDLFKSVTGDVLDRELLTRYTEVSAQWPAFASRVTVRNFKPKKLIDLLGGRSALDAVPELTEYPGADYATAEHEIKVGKFGRRFGFSWEASVNDDLDELMNLPSAFANAASATEDKAAIDLVANADGSPNTAFFKDYSGSGGPNTTPVVGELTHDNLSTAITTVSTREDSEGNVVAPDGLVLVVGPAQEMNAEKILNATEVRSTVGSKTVLEPNTLRGKITLVVNRRLKGSAWFVLPRPNGPRPAVAVAFLRGWETPDLRIKSDTGQRMGGGAIDPSEGSFDEDAVYYRVRHVTGSASVDPIHTYAGTGAAS